MLYSPRFTLSTVRSNQTTGQKKMGFILFIILLSLTELHRLEKAEIRTCVTATASFPAGICEQ